MSELDLETRSDLITRGLGRVDETDLQLIKTVLQEKKRPNLFWGVAPTGRPHIGYLVPFVKIAEFVEAGVEVKILLADLYAFLVNYKHPRPLVARRAQYYQFALSAVFESILGLPVSNIEFHQETFYASTPEFINYTYELLSLTSQAVARSPNDELRNTTMLSPLMVPIVQILDELFMDCDFQLGGLDQAGYNVYGDEYLPKIGHTKKHAHIYNKMLPGLTGTKMSASDPKSKIDLLDSHELVEQKIMEAVCDTAMNTEENPILALLKIVLLPISRLRLAHAARTKAIATYIPFTETGAPDGVLFSVVTESGEHRHYQWYEDLERDFLNKELSTTTLKKAVAKTMNQLLEPIRKSFAANPQWQKVLKVAYPDSEEDATPSPTRDASERFCIPAALREISNEKVKLIPFNSTLHATQFVKIAKLAPEIWTHGPIGPFETAQSFISDFIEAFVRPRTDMLLYTIIDKTKPTDGVDKDGALAGLISYLNTSAVNQCTEIGFVVTLPQFQRTHVTSNAVGLLLKFAFSPPGEDGLGLRRVQWMTSSANTKSITTAEKMGFSREGVLRWDRLYPGGGKKGKESNGKILSHPGKVTHLVEDDLGRDSVLLSMCWDDWFLEGKRELVAQRMV